MPFQDGNVTVKVTAGDLVPAPNTNIMEKEYTFKVMSLPPPVEFYYSQEKTGYLIEGSLHPSDSDILENMEDDGFQKIDLTQSQIDFHFEFFGREVNSLYVSSNGF